MKKKLISVIAIVLVVCFVWVAEANAADITSIDVYQAELIVSQAVNNSNFNDGDNWFTCPIIIDGQAYSYLYTSNKNAQTNIYELLNIFPAGDVVNLKVLVATPSSVSSVDSTNFNGRPSTSFPYTIDLVSMDKSSCVLIYDGDAIELNCILYNLRYTSNSDSFDKFGFNLGASGLGMCYIGFLCELQVFGLSDDEKSLLEQIKIGVDDANSQLDDMQSEQSSYYQDILESEASDTGVIAEASSQKDKFDGVMSEYSSLNEALDRPDVNELLPDYSSVVGGYKDDEFYDVFDVFYGNGYIMFMLLASVFFATMSFVIFGKKA